MANETVKHLKWITRQQKRAGIGESPLEPIAPASFTPSKTIRVLEALNDHHEGSIVWKFGFWSVKGAVKRIPPPTAVGKLFTPSFPSLGPMGTFLTGDKEIAYLTGDSDIAAIAWYLPDDASNPGSAIQIECYDIIGQNTTDDDFVSILPDDRVGTATEIANVTGIVNTEDHDQTIDAFGTLQLKVAAFSGDNRRRWFHYWELKWASSRATPPGSPPFVSPARPYQIIAPKFSSAWPAIAFYGEETYFDIPVNRTFDWQWGIKTHWGVGPGGPVGPRDPWLEHFVTALTLADVANRVAPELRKSVLEIASKQISIASDAIKKELSQSLRGLANNLQ